VAGESGKVFGARSTVGEVRGAGGGWGWWPGGWFSCTTPDESQHDCARGCITEAWRSGVHGTLHIIYAGRLLDICSWPLVRFCEVVTPELPSFASVLSHGSHT
jgi:hypothetical protein